MFTLAEIGWFALASLLLVLTPGPNMVYCVSRTLCQGRAAGLMSLGGVVLGFLIHLLAAALGLTALLMAAPLSREGLVITVTGMVSAPYVDMTVRMMRQFGVKVTRDGGTFTVKPGGYAARSFSIEPDASAASYFFAAAAIILPWIAVLIANARSNRFDRERRAPAPTRPAQPLPTRASAAQSEPEVVVGEVIEPGRQLPPGGEGHRDG